MYFHRAADDGARVRAFYDDLTDAMADAPYPPGWRKGVYPTQAFLDASIAHGELFLAELDGVLTGCMVLNHAYNDGYAAVTWAADVPDAQLLVIHALGVHPAFARRGIAQRMVQYAIGTARPQGCRALRLDVLGGNVPAERLYTGQGFARRGTVRMFYDDTGWTDYGLYEYLL